VGVIFSICVKWRLKSAMMESLTAPPDMSVPALRAVMDSRVGGFLPRHVFDERLTSAASLGKVTTWGLTSKRLASWL
jgi:hypothetical protein